MPEINYTEIKYKARLGPYGIAYDALSKYYRRNQKPLTFREAQEILESTPQIVLLAGLTLEEVVEKMEKWKMIATLKPAGSKEKVIIPLE